MDAGVSRDNVKASVFYFAWLATIHHAPAKHVLLAN